MRVLSCVLLAAAVSATPINPLTAQATPALIDAMCAKLAQPALSKYTEDFIREPACSLNAQQKQDVCDFSNKFHSCQSGDAIPHSVPEMTALLKEVRQITGRGLKPGIPAKVPSVVDIFSKTYGEGIKRYQTTTPEAQAFIKKWHDEAWKHVDCDRAAMFLSAFKQAYAFVTDASNLSADAWASIQNAFPGFFNAWNSNDAQVMVKIIKNLGPDHDYAADPDTMKQFLDMAMKKFMPEQTGSR